jgi:hypothetical protein
MDPSLVKKRLAALILCNPASGKLRDSNDSVIKAFNVEEGLNDAYKAWEKLGGCYSANGSNIDGDLINVASMAKSPEDALIYLYSYYQVLWTKAKAPLDLLKRSYAASAIAGSNNFLRVTFKISSVQDMIANSRKTSDLWAGSYLGSLLAWQTLLPIIENYGPSSVLSPFIGANPLYVYYAYKKLSDPNLKKELSKFARNILELDLNSQLPVNALLPAKADLLIPDYGKNISDIKQEIETYYKNAWRSIYNVLKGYIQSKPSKFNTLNNMEGLLDEAAEWPPFPIEEVGVEQVTVDDLIKGNKQENVISKWQRIWVDYGYGLASSAQTATEKLYQEGRERYKYCTTCGINIAAVELAENGISEPLCPYCAAKRVLSDPDILDIVLKELGFWVPKNVEWLRWPSTATLAGAEALLNALEKEKKEDLCPEQKDLRQKLLCAEAIYGDVEKTLRMIGDYKTHYYILRGDTDNNSKNFSENSQLEKYIGLSRDFALMALASVKVIEKNGGFVVYSGGDDLSAIFPNVGEVPVVIKALIELIKPCYENKEQTIGNEDYKTSFIVDNERKKPKENNGNYIIYCRSYSILAAHSRDPLSVAWKMSGDLIELKDIFTWQKEGDDHPTAKNVVFILRGSGHIESLIDMKKKAALLPAISEVWSENGALPTLLGLRGKGLAKGVAHDALREIDMYGIYKGGSGKEWETLSLKVLEMILKRSELNKNAASEALKVLEPLKSVKAELNRAKERQTIVSREASRTADGEVESIIKRQTIVSWEVLRALSYLR